jgi:hypothetical protein
MSHEPFSRRPRRLGVATGVHARALVLVTTAVLAVALAALAAPAEAGKAPTSAIATQSWNGCDMTVTYTWSGFTGRVAGGVGYTKSPNTSGATNLPGQQGHGGTVNYTFSFTPTAGSNDFRAQGFLVNHKGVIIPDSLVLSSSESHACE